MKPVQNSLYWIFEAVGGGILEAGHVVIDIIKAAYHAPRPQVPLQSMVDAPRIGIKFHDSVEVIRNSRYRDVVFRLSLQESERILGVLEQVDKSAAQETLRHARFQESFGTHRYTNREMAWQESKMFVDLARSNAETAHANAAPQLGALKDIMTELLYDQEKKAGHPLVEARLVISRLGD
jgi:hypothetical protein